MEPTERSMAPVVITNVMATATITVGAIWRSDVDEVVGGQERVGLDAEEDEEHSEHDDDRQHPEVPAQNSCRAAVERLRAAGRRADWSGCHRVTSPSSR